MEEKTVDEVVVENPEMVEPTVTKPMKVKWQPKPFYPAAGEDWQIINNGHKFVRQPYKIIHEDGKPNDNMIQTLMNMKTLSSEFKSKCMECFTISNWKWIKRRILNAVGSAEYVQALAVKDMLIEQIKRDKKYRKELIKNYVPESV